MSSHEMIWTSRGTINPSHENALSLHDLRNTHTFRQPIFSKTSILTKQRWLEDPVWRKRECYTYISRKILQRPSLKRYTDFHWFDYVERTQIIKTFNIRHRPFCIGTKYLPPRLVPDLKEWKTTRTTGDDTPAASSSSTPRNKRSKSSTPQHTTPVSKSLMWDFEEEKWVPNTMGTRREGFEDEDEDEDTPRNKRKKSGSGSKKKRSRWLLCWFCFFLPVKYIIFGRYLLL